MAANASPRHDLEPLDPANEAQLPRGIIIVGGLGPNPVRNDYVAVVSATLQRLSSPQDLAECNGRDWANINRPRQRVPLTGPGRLGAAGDQPHASHPQRIQSVMVQFHGDTKLAGQTCTYCAAQRTNPAFQKCTVLGNIGQGACGNCLWNQNAQGCSFHPNHIGEGGSGPSQSQPRARSRSPDRPGSRAGTRSRRDRDELTPIDHDIGRRRGRGRGRA